MSEDTDCGLIQYVRRNLSDFDPWWSGGYHPVVPAGSGRKGSIIHAVPVSLRRGSGMRSGVAQW